LSIRKKSFATVARDTKEYERNVSPTNNFLEKLKERKIDVFTFIERAWCCKLPSQPSNALRTGDNVALLQVNSYNEWWEKVGKKTRNMVRKAEKAGIQTKIIEPNEKLAEGIWKIYNETPVRQQRAFPHYGMSLETVRDIVFSAQNCSFVGSIFQNEELVGFIQLVHGEEIAIVSQILSLTSFWDKAVGNALLAKAVEVVSDKRGKWLMYGRIGNHPSLDKFKESNGFTRFPIPRYYVPLTRKGKTVISLGLVRDLRDSLPTPIKYRLIPLFNWVSRTKMKTKLARKSKKTQ
jgi:hypothetical protein